VCGRGAEAEAVQSARKPLSPRQQHTHACLPPLLPCTTPATPCRRDRHDGADVRGAAAAQPAGGQRAASARCVCEVARHPVAHSFSPHSNSCSSCSSTPPSTHTTPGAAGGGLSAPSQGNLLDWADKALGQGISSVTRSVKNLLSGARQAPVAAALEALMDGKQVSVSLGGAWCVLARYSSECVCVSVCVLERASRL
jgi:hypothetical protein